MKKISKTNMKVLEYLIGECNDYSELVSLNRYKEVEKELLEWNRGHYYAIEEHLLKFAGLLGVKLVTEFKTHPFLNFSLEYITWHIEGEDTGYHRTRHSPIKQP